MFGERQSLSASQAAEPQVFADSTVRNLDKHGACRTPPSGDGKPSTYKLSTFQ